MTLACKKAFVVDGEHLSTNTNVLTNASDAILPRNHCAASDLQRASCFLPQTPPETSCVLEDEVCYVCYPRNYSPGPEWMDGTNSLWQFWHITRDYKLKKIHSLFLVWMKISIFWVCSFEPRPARGFFLIKGSLSFCWGQVLGFCKALRDNLNCNKYKQRWIKLSFKTELFSIRLHKLTGSWWAVTGWS